jgi:hypothetical protein
MTSDHETTGAGVTWGEQLFRLFILGSGFSRPAGLPLGDELWNEIRRRVSMLSGRAPGDFDRDLAKFIEFKEICDHVTLTADRVDFEDFLSFLDVEHYLALRGPDTWSDEGNETQVVVKTLIGMVLAERTPSKDRIPDLYLHFARALRPNDIVLTFNYDTLLERALEAVAKPYRLFQDRYENDRDNEVVVLKLHGSVDWFDRSSYSQSEETWLRQGNARGPFHPVFNGNPGVKVSRLVDDDSRSADDPLSSMFRVENIEELYKSNIMFHATPWLLAPSPMKLLYSRKLREFWFGLGGAGQMNFGLGIIGYSIPPGDEYARRILFQLVRNYQRVYWDKDFNGLKKTPLVLVDLRESPSEEEKYRGRYSFVDWQRAKLHMGGFDESVVRLFE